MERKDQTVSLNGIISQEVRGRAGGGGRSPPYPRTQKFKFLRLWAWLRSSQPTDHSDPMSSSPTARVGASPNVPPQDSTPVKDAVLGASPTSLLNPPVPLFPHRKMEIILVPTSQGYGENGNQYTSSSNKSAEHIRSINIILIIQPLTGLMWQPKEKTVDTARNTEMVVPCTRSFLKPFTFPMLFNLHKKNSTRWGNRDSEKLKDLPKSSQQKSANNND